MLITICVDVLVSFQGIFFFKQKTAYEMRISDWSSDVCSSDLAPGSRRDSSCGSWRRHAVSGNRAYRQTHTAHARASGHRECGAESFAPCARQDRKSVV